MGLQVNLHTAWVKNACLRRSSRIWPRVIGRLADQYRQCFGAFRNCACASDISPVYFSRRSGHGLAEVTQYEDRGRCMVSVDGSGSRCYVISLYGSGSVISHTTAARQERGVEQPGVVIRFIPRRAAGKRILSSSASFRARHWTFEQCASRSKTVAIVAGMAGVRCRQPDAFFSIGAAGRLAAKGLPDAFQVRSSERLRQQCRPRLLWNGRADTGLTAAA